METGFSHFYANGALLVMWGALLFHLLLPIPHAAHQSLCGTSSLNCWQVRSIHQPVMRKISCLAPSHGVDDFPDDGTSLALKPLVWQPQLFDLALLLLSLDWRRQETLANQLAQALAKEDKPQARALLQPFVNRQTTTLSALGLARREWKP